MSMPSGRNSSTERPNESTSRTVDDEMSATEAGVKSMTVVIEGQRRWFVASIVRSYSKSVVLRTPRMMAQAPAASANSPVSPV